MKRRRLHVSLLWVGGALAISMAPAARSETIFEALASAYRTHSGIRSAEAQVKVVSETIAQAQANQLPHLTATVRNGRHSDATIDFNQFGPPSYGADRYKVLSWQATLAQPIYRGGAVTAGIAKAEADAAGQGAALAVTTQSVLFNAASAYVGLVRAREDLLAIEQSVQGLSVQKESVAIKLSRNDATTVDMDQAIGRLEDARAQQQQAAGQLVAATATYRRWIGHDPLELTAPPPIERLPASREALIQEATRSNHALRQAGLAERAARSDIDIAIAPTLPSMTLIAQYSNEVDRLGDQRGASRSYSVMLQISIPLYQGGAPAAQIRTSQEVHRQRQFQVEQLRDQVQQGATSAWNARVSALAELRARKVQNEAAKVALEGLQRELLKGIRTELDVLNGRQELLSAQLAENKARQDLVLSEYRILAAIGCLSPECLQLPITPAVNEGEPVQSQRRWTDYNSWFR